jgi:CBS domain-containing protein
VFASRIPTHSRGTQCDTWFMIHLSPCLKAPADTPIRDCIEKMNESRVGSILVVGDRAEERGLLQGIFTERDLLKNFELLRSEDLAARPVRTIMTRKVITLEMNELDQAAKIMINQGIRHLPIVAGSVVETESSEPDRTLIGVISIRDLLRWNIEGSPLFRKDDDRSGATDPETELLLRTNDKDVKTLFSTILRTLRKADWNFRLHVPGSNRLITPDVTILDLDHIPTEDWKSAIVELAGKKQTERSSLVVLFDPAKHEPKVAIQLKKLDGLIPGLSIFYKPVDLLGLTGVLTKAARRA